MPCHTVQQETTKHLGSIGFLWDAVASRYLMYREKVGFLNRVSQIRFLSEAPPHGIFAHSVSKLRSRACASSLCLLCQSHGSLGAVIPRIIFACSAAKRGFPAS